MTDAADPGLAQQVLNHPLRLLVCALAEVMMPNPPLGIDEIEGRPIGVLERTPYRMIAIDRDRILDPQVRHGSAHILDLFFKGELRRVHADHDQSLLRVFLGPRADIGQLAEPIDAGIGPEVDEDHFPAQAGRPQWRRIEPSGRAAERRQLPFNGELHRGGRSSAAPSQADVPVRSCSDWAGAAPALPRTGRQRT